MTGEETPESRPDSRISQSADEDDTNSFHDVDENDDTTSTNGDPAQPSDEIAASEEPHLASNEKEEVKVEAGESQSPPPDHLNPTDPTSTSTAMSSTTSLHLAHDDPTVTTLDELVASLRGQITDLTSQVTSLNGKLVKSYTTRGDLEDNLHDTQEVERQLRTRVKDLEADKEKWTKEIEQGGWVERVRLSFLSSQSSHASTHLNCHFPTARITFKEKCRG